MPVVPARLSPAPGSSRADRTLGGWRQPGWLVPASPAAAVMQQQTRIAPSRQVTQEEPHPWPTGPAALGAHHLREGDRAAIPRLIHGAQAELHVVLGDVERDGGD